jgi:hypothetical protein
MINGVIWLKTVLNHDKRCETVVTDEGRSGTVRDGEGR